MLIFLVWNQKAESGSRNIKWMKKEWVVGRLWRRRGHDVNTGTRPFSESSLSLHFSVHGHRFWQMMSGVSNWVLNKLSIFPELGLPKSYVELSYLLSTSFMAPYLYTVMRSASHFEISWMCSSESRLWWYAQSTRYHHSRLTNIIARPKHNSYTDLLYSYFRVPGNNFLLRSKIRQTWTILVPNQ